MPTAPELLPTVSAGVADNAGTVTFFPSGGTHSVPTDAPDPIVVSARMTRLRDAGWLDVRWCGGGGMGEVYDGFDPGIQRQVVAKFIRRDAISDSTRDRFRVEAATLARLVHKNVARLFAYSEGHDPYLVMEYVDGGTLSELIRRGALPAREAAAILEGVARGVAAAHAGGVVHRDLKPSNVLLDRSGSAVVPKVTDFGMAKDADAVEPLTGSNAVLGTPEFMSPEQAARRSAACDARSDVWGLSATLYTAVTGHPPYTRDLLNPPVLTDPLTPPTAHTPDLPADLAAVITMGLEKHPNDRYQTAAGFADDLNRFLAGEPVHARRRAWPVRVWRRARRVSTGTAVAVLFAVVALAAVGATYFGRAPSGEVKIARKMATLADKQAVTLIRVGEPPVWHRPLLGFPTVVPSATGDCTVTAVGSAIIQFTPDLPVSHYLVKLTVADIDSSPVTKPGEAVHRFGLLLGAECLAGQNGLTTVAGFALEYHDLLKHDENDRPLHARADTVFRSWFERAGRPVNPYTSQLRYQPMKPTRVGRTAGLFRDIEIEVSPTGIRGGWPGAPATDRARGFAYSVLELDDKVRVHTQEVPHHQPDASTAYPNWNPTRGVAVILNSCTIAIRHLEIVPLDD